MNKLEILKAANMAGIRVSLQAGKFRLAGRVVEAAEVLILIEGGSVCCPRCQGQGVVMGFSHVQAGICFQCQGSGDHTRPLTQFSGTLTESAHRALHVHISDTDVDTSAL